MKDNELKIKERLIKKGHEKANENEQTKNN